MDIDSGEDTAQLDRPSGSALQGSREIDPWRRERLIERAKKAVAVPVAAVIAVFVLSIGATVAIATFQSFREHDPVAGFEAVPGAGDTGISGGQGRADPLALKAPGPDSGTATIFVHVAGEIERPGLYELVAGSRVADAIAEAGGMTASASGTGINLARVLIDGEQIVVPHEDDDPDATGGHSSASAGGAAGSVPGKVSLNSATAAELETLPRVGPALASRIVSWRQANGGFGSIEELTQVSGIGAKTFDELKDLVTL